MNDLVVREKRNVNGMEFTEIEGGFGENRKAMLVRDIAEIHSRPLGKINELIGNNATRFTEGKDILDLKANPCQGLGYESLGYTKQTYNQSNNIYLLSERGYSKLLKILEDDKAWEQYELLVDGYFNMRASTTLTNLSPQLQFLITMETRQTEMQKQIDYTDKKVDGIKEIVGLCPNDWRKDSTALIMKIAASLGGNEYIQTVRNEAYELLDQRYGVQLKTRLTNKRKTLALNGVCKSKIDKVNRLDVIADDRKMIEGFVTIVKELSIKYGLYEVYA